jgi:hypothetical protein
VGTFVSSSIRTPFEASLARWNQLICRLAVGLPPEEGEFVRARLSKIAAAAGAHLAPLRCQANVVVIASAEPDAVLKASILRLFSASDEAKPTGLSAWDTAFLKALYQNRPRLQTAALCDHTEYGPRHRTLTIQGQQRDVGPWH